MIMIELLSEIWEFFLCLEFEQILVLIAVLFFSIFDPLRDYGVNRRIGWWEWHIYKWLASYPVIGLLVYLNFDLVACGIIMIGSWIIWSLSLFLFTDAAWDGTFLRLVKGIIKIFRIIFNAKRWR